MVELGASTGKLGLKFWGIPHPCSHVGSTRFGTSRAQRHCRALGEGGGSKLPSRVSQCSPLRLDTVLLRCAVEIARQQATNLTDCRPCGVLGFVTTETQPENAWVARLAPRGSVISKAVFRAAANKGVCGPGAARPGLAVKAPSPLSAPYQEA